MADHSDPFGDGRARELFERLCRDGVSAVDALVDARAAEELFLDFKRSADDGVGAVLHAHDRKNLAKAISGFGNSEGGVVVWGVECKAVPSQKHPITAVSAFVSRLNDQVGGCTIPPHSGVDTRAILLPNSADGFAVTYVPTSAHCPHQTTGDSRYYMRVGSTFGHMPHAVLAGMFGRRPQPVPSLDLVPQSVDVSHITRGSEFEGDVMTAYYRARVGNQGPCVIRGAFLAVEAVPAGPNCNLYCHGRLPDHFLYVHTSETSFWAMAKDTFLVPPSGSVHPIEIRLALAPPFDNEMIIDVAFGCEGSAAYRHRWTTSAEVVDDLYHRATEAAQSPLQSADLALLLITGRQ